MGNIFVSIEMATAKLLMCLLLCYITCIVVSNADDDNTTINGDSVNGEMLVSLGRQIKNPLLTLIGLAIRNQKPCSEWTKWSACTATGRGNFGTRNRTRTCNEKNSERTSTEEDIRVCEELCIESYNRTGNSYCLKLYDVGKSWDEAEKVCQNDGGHLAYLDNDVKYSDVKKMLEGNSRNAWIDGRRKDTSLPWETVHGVKLTMFHWKSGQPGNTSTELCLVLDSGNNREWHDAACTSGYYPLCEITA